MSPLRHHLKKASDFISTSPLIATKDRQTKHAITQFAKKAGLVYFGSITIETNDSRLVRGATLASGYKDAHYCFGVHDGYDIVCVQRQAQSKFPGKKSTLHSWMIMEFDLHSATPLPHILIGRKGQAELLYDNLLATQRDMQPHVFSAPETHNKEYSRQYVTYSPPVHAPMVDFILSPEFTSAIVGHFKHLMIEIEGDSLYLMVDQTKLSVPFLDKMMHYGLQVAKHIDERVGAS